MEKLIDLVELPANVTLTFFEENPVYFWSGILSILMIVWVGKLIIEKSKHKPKFKPGDRIQYAGKLGEIVRYDKKHFLPYVVWFDDETTDQFDDSMLKPVKLEWAKPETCEELKIGQKVRICSDIEQSEELGKICLIVETRNNQPNVTIEFEDYWDSRFINCKLDQILILKEFTDSQMKKVQNCEVLEKCEVTTEFLNDSKSSNIQIFEVGDEVVNCSPIKDEYSDKIGVVCAKHNGYVFVKFDYKDKMVVSGQYMRAFKPFELLKTGNKKSIPQTILVSSKDIFPNLTKEEYEDSEESENIEEGHEFEDFNDGKWVVIRKMKDNFWMCCSKTKIRFCSFSESKILSFNTNFQHLKNLNVEKSVYDYFVFQHKINDALSELKQMYVKETKEKCIVIGNSEQNSNIGAFLMDSKIFQLFEPGKLCEKLEQCKSEDVKEFSVTPRSSHEDELVVKWNLPVFLNKVYSEAMKVTFEQTKKSEKLENVKVDSKFPTNHIPLKLRTSRVNKKTSYYVDEIEVSKEEYEVLLGNFSKSRKKINNEFDKVLEVPKLKEYDMKKLEKEILNIFK